MFRNEKEVCKNGGEKSARGGFGATAIRVAGVFVVTLTVCAAFFSIWCAIAYAGVRAGLRADGKEDNGEAEFYDEYGDEDSTAFASGKSSAALMDVATGRLLYGVNEDVQLPMASTTKILTAIAVIESVPDLSQKIAIPKAAVGIEGSSIYLKEGEELSYKDLLYGLMLRSGNDCAVALAISVSGSVEGFSALMNAKAREYGATSSSFVNPHGLHADNHYTTARDLALITSHALKNTAFREISGTKSVRIPGTDGMRYLQNKNKMLWQFEGANGVKTGYTHAAGRCLVSSAERKGVTLVAVVLNRPDMWDACKSMMETAFKKYSPHKLFDLTEPLTAEIENAEFPRCFLSVPEAPVYLLTDEEKDNLRVVIETRILSAPVVTGTEAGEIKVFIGNFLLYSEKLYIINDVDKD
ncbi:MAG: D-alanyl-D-alanine carboxypeptidase [Clostridiaceae bacterium]|jgi:D-alanyl-D-alanine carboxypeptidase (penicillin-binding protein 5/6)|nr:D-alanyl-D-alanine carboxypeptidase [Clostridiaceae bacterium]